MSITREEIRQLCIAHDRFMAEQASEPIRRPPVSEPDDAGLIYKEHDNSERAPAAEPAAATLEGVWSDATVEALCDILDNVENRMRQEFDRKLAVLEGENRELKGMLGATLTLLGQKEFKTADVVDLPDWKRSHGT